MCLAKLSKDSGNSHTVPLLEEKVGDGLDSL